MIIDLHTHILPGLDNGAQTIEDAINIVEIENKNDVSILVATPHYYPKEMSIDDFIEKRNSAYEKLLQESAHIALPSIRLGAQVHYDSSLLSYENIYELCIENTDYMLLDLPNDKISNDLINELEILCSTCNISPIITHFDRLYKNNEFEAIQALMDLNVLGEMDTFAFLNIAEEKMIKQLLRNEYINVVSSDIHNAVDKTISIKNISDYLHKKRKKKFFNRLMQNAKFILSNENIDRII